MARGLKVLMLSVFLCGRPPHFIFNLRRWQTSNAAVSKSASMWERYPPAVPFFKGCLDSESAVHMGPWCRRAAWLGCRSCGCAKSAPHLIELRYRAWRCTQQVTERYRPGPPISQSQGEPALSHTHAKPVQLPSATQQGFAFRMALFAHGVSAPATNQRGGRSLKTRPGL